MDIHSYGWRLRLATLYARLCFLVIIQQLLFLSSNILSFLCIDVCMM